ncbi:MAG: hypothetical protein K2X82_02605, partial [Gemmataceae bacterium]|nr:hypothetical protein [Gemmataceae bacterium]
MERVRQVTRPAVGAALTLCLAAGCIHVHTDGTGKVKSVELKAGSPSEEAAAKTDGGVKQASATVPAPISLPALPSLSKMAGFTGPGAAPIPGTVILTMFENRVVPLPDPTRNDAPTPGLVGQLFLFGAGSKMPFAPADGPMTFVMYDETSGKPAETPIGSWTFDRVTLARLLTTDERFGRCYALFLPWPDYKPSVTRVRITARYAPENGPPLTAPPQTVTLDGNAAREVKDQPGALPPPSGLGP